MLSKKSVAAFLLGSALACGFSTGAMAQADNDVFARTSAAAEMTKKDLAEALRQYLEIRIEYAGAEIDYSIGRTYERLFQCSSTQKYYTAVMVNYNLTTGNPIFDRAVKNYDNVAMCDTWQKVYLDCSIPEGGTVMIDNERIGQCWDRPYSLPDGEHVFKLIKKSGEEHVVKFTAKSGAPDAHVNVAFPAERVEVEKIVERVENYEYRERFHPALYWGLISGGVLFLGGSGWFSAMANNALVDVQKYEDRYAVLQDESWKKKANDARDKVDLGNALMYTSLGVGGALAVTGVALAIVSHMSPKEKVDLDNVNAYVAPNDGGMMAGVGLTF